MTRPTKPILRFVRLLTIDEKTGCWLSSGSISANGYSRFWDGKTTVLAHRWAYEHYHGRPVPAGLQVDHLCRVRNCVNPMHLEAVTQQQNLLRGATIPAAHAAKTHCPADHEYNSTNSFTYKGSRYCRLCNNARSKARRQSIKQGAT